MYYFRLIESLLQSQASKNKIKVVLGPRQTGKSTLLKHLLPPSGKWINLQEGSVRTQYEARPHVFSEQLQGYEKKKKAQQTVIVDEIQKVPALLDEVQYLFDQSPKEYDFYLTGSSARKLRSHSANLLPGRSHVFNLSPLTLWETEENATSTILTTPVQTRHKKFPKSGITQKLLFGSLPGIYLEKPESQKLSLRGYVELYLEEEIRREGVIKDIGPFHRFLELAALESGNIMNLTKLSNESGIAITTIRHYYQVLIDTFMGYWIDSYITQDRKRLLTTPRFYMFDLGVRNAAAKLPLNEDLITLHGGHLIEHWVGLELIHRTKLLGPEYQTYFWKTKSGAEVDFVLKTPKEVIPIEVKWTDKPNLQDGRHLRTFMEHEKKAQRGYIVCRVPEIRKLDTHIWAIPWNCL